MSIKVKKLTLTAILAAVSSVLMFFSINVPLMPSFIKLDLSELPALIASFVLGPLSGVCVCFVKNAINLFFTTTSGIGELSNFLLGCFFVVPAGYIYKMKKTKTSAIVGATLGALAMAVFSVFTNFFITYPIYFNFMPMEAILNMYHVINPFVGTDPNDLNLIKALLLFNLPFTFIKGMISVFVTMLVYKPLESFLNGKY